VGTFDPKAAFAQGGKMCPAGNEHDIGAPLGEPRAKISAQRARPHDRNPHVVKFPPVPGVAW
jgi:hypothetical protein